MSDCPDQIHVGDDLRLPAEFKNTAGTLIDPGVVKVKVKDPDGTETEYTYGTDAELVKTAIGAYHIDVPVTAPGVWRWKFFSTGSGKAANEGSFKVEETYF